MREIEFRAWDKREKRMVCWNDISRTNILGMLVNNNNRGNSSGILMQNTGLLDKNGIKIFEGDIVKIKNCWTNGVDKTSDMIGVVVFFECEFQVKDECDNYLSIARYREKNEVIGNKFENPELLGKDK